MRIQITAKSTLKNTLEEAGETFKNLFGVSGDVWVKRVGFSRYDLDVLNGVARADPETRTCAFCVALNNTIFKNTNKPEYYHLRCKCKNIPVDTPRIVLDFPMEKVTKYLFLEENKYKMMKSMGYDIEDGLEIYNLIAQNVKNLFLDNKYELKSLNENGQHFQISFNIYGKCNCVGKIYRCHTGCVAWANGKLKIATPLIKDKEMLDAVFG